MLSKKKKKKGFNVFDGTDQIIKWTVKSHKIVQTRVCRCSKKASKEKILKVVEKTNEFRVKNNTEKKEDGKLRTNHPSQAVNGVGQMKTSD